MNIVLKRFPGITLLMNLNADRLFTMGTIVVGLLSGAYLGTAIFGH